ncbi:MAG: nuclear transport factor 2 family protein [Burkholderiaceae bacterium]|nr:nuclear transport factor 2 family protein [Burkholderiaceae bacterium]
MTDRRLAHIRAYFETLAPESLARLHEVYTEQAHFTDPFNDVRGIEAIRRVFDHMFAHLAQPRFEIRAGHVAGRAAFVTWDFRFGLRGRPCALHGASLLHLAADGRIEQHVDYWDAAALYERLPLIGPPLRWVRRRLAA